MTYTYVVFGHVHVFKNWHQFHAKKRKKAKIITFEKGESVT